MGSSINVNKKTMKAFIIIHRNSWNVNRGNYSPLVEKTILADNINEVAKMTGGRLDVDRQILIFDKEIFKNVDENSTDDYKIYSYTIGNFKIFLHPGMEYVAFNILECEIFQT